MFPGHDKLSRSAPCALIVAILALAGPTKALADPIVKAGSSSTSETSETAAVAPTTTPDAAEASPNYWLPALESIAFNIAMNRISLWGGAQFADISLGTMKDNITGGFVWDNDLFNTNQIRHPYMGSTYFALARSSGHGFWASSAYTFMGSLMWELLMENEPPAYNDQVSTAYGGMLLGEGLYRLGEGLLWRSSSPWAEVAASLLSPGTGFNRHVMRQRSLLHPPAPMFTALRLGHNSFTLTKADGVALERGLGQIHVGFVGSYGLPGDPKFTPTKPMDHFDMVADLSIAERRVIGTLFIRGLLYGRSFGGDRLRGLWGLFGSYDYFSPSNVRVAAVGAGPGVSMQLRLGRKSFLQGSYLLSAIPVAAAGVTSLVGERDYHFGPGASQVTELRLGRADTGMLTLTNRSFGVFDTSTDTIEVITFGSLSGQFKVWRRHGLGFELIASTRRDSSDKKFLDTGGQVRVFYTLLSDPSFGAVLD